MSQRSYFECVDIQQMLRDYPVGADFTRRYRSISRDELRALQEVQFARLMARGWQIPFYPSSVIYPPRFEQH